MRRRLSICSQDILVIFQVSTPDQRAEKQGAGEGQSVGGRNKTSWMGA